MKQAMQDIANIVWCPTVSPDASKAAPQKVGFHGPSQLLRRQGRGPQAIDASDNTHRVMASHDESRRRKERLACHHSGRKQQHLRGDLGAQRGHCILLFQTKRSEGMQSIFFLKTFTALFPDYSPSQSQEIFEQFCTIYHIQLIYSIIIITYVYNLCIYIYNIHMYTVLSHT